MGTAKKEWRGENPIACDICGHKFGTNDKSFYDFKTKMGPWGIGCQSCFQKYGNGLGTGCGQRYNLKTMEKET